MQKSLGRNTKSYRTAIRNLRDAARKVKECYREKYDAKQEHLRDKYRETEQENLYIELSIFEREKYNRIETLSYEVTCAGEVNLTNEEKSVLTMHPKFSIIDTLQEGALEFEQ